MPLAWFRATRTRSEDASRYFHRRVLNLNPGVIDTDMLSTIRRSEFPGVQDFIALKNDGKLKSPDIVARNLVWMIDRAE